MPNSSLHTGNSAGTMTAGRVNGVQEDASFSVTVEPQKSTLFLARS